FALNICLDKSQNSFYTFFQESKFLSASAKFLSAISISQIPISKTRMKKMKIPMRSNYRFSDK
ncbi:hypothetical protein JXL19_09715, partial [bacterium]|nr:hypothetical protein [bacterium]